MACDRNQYYHWKYSIKSQNSFGADSISTAFKKFIFKSKSNGGSLYKKQCLFLESEEVLVLKLFLKKTKHNGRTSLE